MPATSSQSALYSEKNARDAGLTLAKLGLASWNPADVIALQTKIGASPADGWFGPKSIETWKTWAKTHQPAPVSPPTNKPAPGTVIINGVGHMPPPGLILVNFAEAEGIPAQLDDTSERKHTVTQFVIHRGAETKMKSEPTYAHATERVLDARGLSTTFSMAEDGAIYQHFDPALRRGRHASWHNVQSDSIDIGGPFMQTTSPLPGQTAVRMMMAIGRVNDKTPPLKRAYGHVDCWTMTPAQTAALALFLPWYCNLRGIPVTACEDWRCFRVDETLGVNDPVTNVKGILAHAQIGEPGHRVDGCMELQCVKDAGAAIQWRSFKEFFNT